MLLDTTPRKQDRARRKESLKEWGQRLAGVWWLTLSFHVILIGDTARGRPDAGFSAVAQALALIGFLFVSLVLPSIAFDMGRLAGEGEGEDDP